MDYNHFNREKFYGIEEELDGNFGTHFDDHFHSSFDEAEKMHWWFTRIFFTIFGLIFFAIVCYIVFVLCFVCCKICKRKQNNGCVYRETTNAAANDDGSK